MSESNGFILSTTTDELSGKERLIKEQSNLNSVHVAHIRINMTLEGELADFLRELKVRGEIGSYSEGIMRAVSRMKEIYLKKRLIETRLDSNAIGRRGLV